MGSGISTLRDTVGKPAILGAGGRYVPESTNTLADTP
jgi:hypothetical protein